MTIISIRTVEKSKNKKRNRNLKATMSRNTLAYPAPSLHHELGVSLSACDDHIHPDPHGLRRGSNHVVDSVMSLYTEGEGRVWALRERKEGERREEPVNNGTKNTEGRWWMKNGEWETDRET